MGKAVVLGPVPLQQPIQYRVDRTNGTAVTRTWIGTFQAIENVRRLEQAFAESMEVTSKGAVFTLTARYSQASPDGKAEVPTETQELDTELVQQSIFMNAKFAALLPEEVDLIRRTFQNPPLDATARGQTVFGYDAAIAVIQGGTDTGAKGVNRARWVMAEAAYELLTRGAESFDNYAFVLNRTRTASRRFAGKLKLTSIGKVCTTTNLVKYTGNPLLFDSPDISLTADENQQNLIPGWRLRVCRVSDNSNGSRQLIEQWILGKHSGWLYDRYTP